MNDFKRAQRLSLILIVVSTFIILSIFGSMVWEKEQLKSKLEEAEKCCNMNK